MSAATTEIRIVLGDTTIQVVLADNTSARDFAALLFNGRFRAGNLDPSAGSFG